MGHQEVYARCVWNLQSAARCCPFLGRAVAPASITCLLVGIGFSRFMYLIPLMNGNVIDMNEHPTQLRRVSRFFGHVGDFWV